MKHGWGNEDLSGRQEGRNGEAFSRKLAFPAILHS